MKIAVLSAAVVLAAGLCAGVQAGDAKHNKADEQQKKQDDPKTWPARDFSSATVIPGALCLLVIDPKPKKNHDAEELEGKDWLGNDEVRAKLRGFSRFKIKSDGSDGKGWPGDWLARAKNGAVLVLLSSDLAHVAVFDKTCHKDSLLKLADPILKYAAERRAEREARAKAEAARNPPPPADKPAVPGLDGKTAKKTSKPSGSKEPQDE